MKVRLEVDLKHIDGPPADVPFILEALRDELESTDFWVQDDENEDESGYTMVTVRSLD